jgi:hypothetical protein
MSNWMVYIVTILRLRVNYALHHEYVEEGRFSIMLFLTSTLVRVEWSASCSHCFNPGDISCDRTLDEPRSSYGCDGGNRKPCSCLEFILEHSVHIMLHVVSSKYYGQFTKVTLF